MIVFTGAAGIVAFRRQRTMALWMVFGAIIGPLALLLLWMAPPGRCGTCQAPVRGWLRVCEWCGSPVAAPRVGTAGGPARSAGPARDVATARQATRTSITRESAAARQATMVPTPQAPVTPPTERASAAGRGDGRPTAPGRAPRGRPGADDPTEARIRERLTSIGPRRGIRDQPVSSIPDSGAAGPSGGNPDVEADGRRRVLATGEYVTGTVSLVGGSRYAFDVGGSTLRILGPVDLDASAVVLTQDLAGIEATGFDERLVLTFGGGGRHGVVLVFSSIEGASAAGVSAAIVSAARATRVAS